jgi:short-subunit dehydrogenase
VTTTLILGATSPIAFATAKLEVKNCSRLLLVGRDSYELEIRKRDLDFQNIFKCQIVTKTIEDENLDWIQFLNTFSELTRIYCFIGALSSENNSYLNQLQDIADNSIFPLKLILPVLKHVQNSKQVKLIIITSVAQFIPRPFVLGYGSGKAALSFATQSLMRSRELRNTYIYEVRLGWVDTSMSFQRTLPTLTYSPCRIAETIIKRTRGRSRAVYVPPWWIFLRLFSPIINFVTLRNVKYFGTWH